MNAQSNQSAQLRARDETTDLFSPYRLGELELANRVVMAPMTRSRAVAGNVPNPLAATYYAQRASAGLIVTEATQVSPQGVGYIRTPGIHSADQVTGWKKVTAAVHQAGGKIFLQLWHVGRISHPDFHGGELPVAPSAISPGVEVFTFEGLKPTVTPRALELAEIPGIVEQFTRARTTPSSPVSTASRSMAPMAICSTSSPATAPTSAPMPTAARSPTARACRSKSRAR